MSFLQRLSKAYGTLIGAREDDATDLETVILTLIQWSKAGLIESGVLLRAPSGAIAAEFTSVMDVPLEAADPRTGKTFRVLLEQVEVHYRLVRPLQKAPAPSDPA